MMTRLRTQTCIAAALAVTLSVAACGGSSKTADLSGQSTPATVTQTVTAPATTTSAATTSTAATSTTAAASTTGPGSACVAADLTPKYLGSNGAAGTLEYGFALVNSSSTACHTYGWPGAEFLTSAGTPIGTGAKRVKSDAVGSVQSTQINLAPGDEASFRVAVHDAVDGGKGCTTAGFLQIYAPDDTTALKVIAKVSACPSATVTPLQPGSEAFAGQ
jgi:hypothetical protein